MHAAEGGGGYTQGGDARALGHAMLHGGRGAAALLAAHTSTCYWHRRRHHNLTHTFLPPPPPPSPPLTAATELRYAVCHGAVTRPCVCVCVQVDLGGVCGERSWLRLASELVRAGGRGVVAWRGVAWRLWGYGGLGVWGRGVGTGLNYGKLWPNPMQRSEEERERGWEGGMPYVWWTGGTGSAYAVLWWTPHGPAATPARERSCPAHAALSPLPTRHASLVPPSLLLTLPIPPSLLPFTILPPSLLTLHGYAFTS